MDDGTSRRQVAWPARVELAFPPSRNAMSLISTVTNMPSYWRWLIVNATSLQVRNDAGTSVRYILLRSISWDHRVLLSSASLGRDVLTRRKLPFLKLLLHTMAWLIAVYLLEVVSWSDRTYYCQWLRGTYPHGFGASSPNRWSSADARLWSWHGHRLPATSDGLVTGNYSLSRIPHETGLDHSTFRFLLITSIFDITLMFSSIVFSTHSRAGKLKWKTRLWTSPSLSQIG